MGGFCSSTALKKAATTSDETGCSDSQGIASENGTKTCHFRPSTLHVRSPARLTSPGMCLLAFIKHAFGGSAPSGRVAPTPEENARQAYILRCLETPSLGALGYPQRRSYTSLASLQLPLLRTMPEEPDRCVWSKSPVRPVALSGDSVMLRDPAGTSHASSEHSRSCGKPCQRPPQECESGVQEGATSTAREERAFFSQRLRGRATVRVSPLSAGAHTASCSDGCPPSYE